MSSVILNQFGRPYQASNVRRGFETPNMVKASYDASKTNHSNMNHWGNADNLDPNSAACYEVRRKLRSRSRYEIIENNPYLKGTILTLANDFVGKGPTLKITDTRVSETERIYIEWFFSKWSQEVKLRQKIWRARIAKFTDGETLLQSYNRLKQKHPVKLNYNVLECDRLTTEGVYEIDPNTPGMIDGIILDENDEPEKYYILDQHPGASQLWAMLGKENSGKWVDAKYIIHWFRKDRGWARGIPELTPSLPLCAILRRYTIAVLRSAEWAASKTGVLETQGPPNATNWYDRDGNQVYDDPFDSMAFDAGEFTTLPWGYKLHQLAAEQPTTLYDSFVNSVLREIVRPALVPFNVSSGSSKDSNMASGVLDNQIYKDGQTAERNNADEDLLERVFEDFWEEVTLIDPRIRRFIDYPSIPDHYWRWPPVGITHTDPQKVANALTKLREFGFMTDSQIQETIYGRDPDEWRKEFLADSKWREENGLTLPSNNLGGQPAAQEDPKDNQDSQDPANNSDD